MEIEVDPPLTHLPYETKLVKNPLPFYVSTYAIIDLFARENACHPLPRMETKIKGRDWYDMIWYIQGGIPVNLEHLRDRMKQTKHLASDEIFNEKELLERLHSRIDQIDWEFAKSDIAPFIPDKSRLDIWSGSF